MRLSVKRACLVPLFFRQWCRSGCLRQRAFFSPFILTAVIDVCANNTCDPKHGACIAGDGGYTCACVDGFTLNAKDNSCKRMPWSWIVSVVRIHWRAKCTCA
jgi:hypothetical protein